MKRCALALALAVLAGGCGGDDDSARVAELEQQVQELQEQLDATTLPPAPRTTVFVEPSTTTTTEPATTTTSSTTTTTVAPTTTLPAPTGQGLVWESSVDPARVNVQEFRPIGDADGVSSAVDLVLVVSASGTTEASVDCADAARSRQEFFGGELATECLIVQWRFDVAADFPVNDNSPDASLTPGDLVTAGGAQIGSGITTSGYPGTVDNGIVEIYPGGGEGSVVRWKTGSNLVGRTEFQFTVPGDLPPIYFD